MVDLYGPISRGIALMKPMLAADFRNLLSESITIIKRKGDNESPCLRPLVALNFPLGLPLIIIERFVDERQPLIHSLHLTAKP